MPESQAIFATVEPLSTPGESAASPCESLDPRIRRTRELLSASLAKLLETKEFERISVQDITVQATVNRATFYAHYPDKFALLECMVASRFHELLARRGVVFTGACVSVIQAIILAACDFLVQHPSSACPGQPMARQRQMEPHLESAIVAVIQQMLLDGIRRHPPEQPAGFALPPEILAAAASWAIFGAARQWVHTPARPSSDEIAPAIFRLVLPILLGPAAAHVTERPGPAPA